MKSIYTIGYGGKKPENFFHELEELDYDLVIDVRENPHRAFLGVYTYPQLAKRLGPKYIWIKELGNKTRQMPPTLVDEQAGMTKLKKLANNYDTIVLLCAEKNEKACHRSYIKKLLESYLD
jgi:uncharacterized protein (DUF488 family)